MRKKFLKSIFIRNRSHQNESLASIFPMATNYKVNIFFDNFFINYRAITFNYPLICFFTI